MLLYPSLISGNLLNIEREIKTLEKYCAGFHIDVMDFHFVQNLTWGPSVVNAIRKMVQKEIWVHLMVDAPEKYIDRLLLSEYDIITIHRENNNIIRTLQHIRKRKLRAGLAYNPTTSLDNDPEILKHVDQIVLMSVDPGFSGQKFISETLVKVDELVAVRATLGLEFSIALDGGINLSNMIQIHKHAVDAAAIGSGLFTTRNPVKILKELAKHTSAAK